MLTKSFMIETMIVAITSMTTTISSLVNHFQEQITKNGTVNSIRYIPLNLTNHTDDDTTTQITLDDEDVTRNMTTTETPTTTAATTTESTTTTEEVPPLNFVQRVLRALLGPTAFVVGPINVDLTGESLFRYSFIKETFGKNGPLNMLNPYAQEIAVSSQKSK